MNEALVSKLEQLAHDSLMLQAINVIITERIEKEKPPITIDDTDEIIGQKFRAYEHAKSILEGALVDISSYNSKNTKPNQINKGK